MDAHGQIQRASHSVAECLSRKARVDFQVKRTLRGLVGHFWVEINSLVEISERLNRCIKIIGSQKMAAMRKLEAKSNQALMAFCLNSGVFINEMSSLALEPPIEHEVGTTCGVHNKNVVNSGLSRKGCSIHTAIASIPVCLRHGGGGCEGRRQCFACDETCL